MALITSECVRVLQTEQAALQSAHTALTASHAKLHVERDGALERQAQMDMEVSRLALSAAANAGMVVSKEVRHCLCLVFPLPLPWLRHCLCLAFSLPFP